jgi:hypothetical protein
MVSCAARQPRLIRPMRTITQYWPRRPSAIKNRVCFHLTWSHTERASSSLN